MPSHLDTLRRIHTTAVTRGPLAPVMADLSREAGMDGNYGHLLQSARDLDAAETPAPAPTAHTPEPWAMVEDGGGSAFSYELRASPGGKLRGIALVYADNPDDGTPGPEDTANAARIVACVNALAGVDDPGAALAEVRRVLLGLEQQESATLAVRQRGKYVGDGYCAQLQQRVTEIRAVLALLGAK